MPLRYHPACPFEGERVGCIVAPVQNLAGEVTAVWRIRLAMEGRVRRLGLGPSKGCLARVVDPGGSGHLAIAEGVEDALAFWALTGTPCWSALSGGNMGVAEIPVSFTQVPSSPTPTRWGSRGLGSCGSACGWRAVRYA